MNLFRSCVFVLLLFSIARGGEQQIELVEFNKLIEIAKSVIPKSKILVIHASYDQNFSGNKIKFLTSEYRKDLSNGDFFVNLQKHQIEVNGDVRPYRVKALYNGEGLYYLENSPVTIGDITLDTGTLSIREFDPTSYPFSRAAFGIPFNLSELSKTGENSPAGMLQDLLKKPNVEISSRSEKGNLVFEFKCEMPGPGSYKNKYSCQVLIDPLTKTLKRFTYSQEIIGDTKYSRVVNMDVREVQEVAEGFFYPTGGSYEELQNGKLVASYSFTISSIKLVSTPLIAKGEFDLPANTRVSDTIHNTSFTTGPSPSELEQAIEKWVKPNSK